MVYFNYFESFNFVDFFDYEDVGVILFDLEIGN